MHILQWCIISAYGTNLLEAKNRKGKRGMKRNVRKALAFSLAVVTAMASLIGATPVMAAEYGEAKNVLEAKYDEYFFMGEETYFVKNVEVIENEGTEKETTVCYVDELVAVDKNGKVTTFNVKGADNNNKYRYVSPGMNMDCLCMIENDWTYDIYYVEDGTWFGNGENAYTHVRELSNGNYLVLLGAACHIVDREENILAKDIFTVVDTEAEGYIGTDCGAYEYSTYTIVYRTVVTYSAEAGYEFNRETKVLDADYKEVSSIDLTGKENEVLYDYLVAYTDTTLAFYDSELKEIDTGIDFSEAGGTITWIWPGYDYAANRDIIQILVYTDAYVWSYYDAKTFEEIAEEDILFSPVEEPEGETDVYEVVYSDLILKFTETGFEYYQGETLLFSYADICEYLAAKYSIEDLVVSEDSVEISPALKAIGDDLIMAFNIRMPDETSVYGQLLFTDETAYEVEKVQILENKRVWIMYLYEDVQWAVFDDYSIYYNNKIYDNGDLQFTGYVLWGDYEYVPTAYILREGEEDAYTWSYVLLDGTVLAKSTTEFYVANGVGTMITRDIVEMEEEGETYSVYKYGCIVVPKVLNSIEDVVDAIESATAGDTVNVTLKEDATLPAEVLGTIKGEDITLVLETSSGIIWTINGKDVTATDLSNINLTVEKVEDVIPTAAINNIKLESSAKVEISLAHTGDFGFSAKLTVNVDKANAGKYANRFYYNPTTKALEFQEAVAIDDNGNAVFTFTHASDYVVLVSEVAYAEGDTTQPDGVGPLGDMSNAGICMTMILGVAVIVAAYSAKRRTNA